MATARQKAYALSLLGQLGYSVRYINKDYKALGLGMKERTGKVTDWLDTLNSAEADRLIKQLRGLQREARDSLPPPEEADAVVETPEARFPVTLDSLLTQVCELEVRIGRQGEAHLQVVKRLNSLIEHLRLRGAQYAQASEKAQTSARRAQAQAEHVRVKHNYHVLRTADPKDIAPGWSRRARQDQLTWAKKRQWPFY